MSEPGTSNGTSPGTSTPAGHLPGLSVDEAARELGVSANTVRRWVRAGTLESERVPRPQGYTVRVHLPEQVPISATSREVPGLAPTQDRAGAMAAYNERLLAPLVDELAATRRQLVDQAEEIGRLRAELQTAREQLALIPPAEPPEMAPSATPDLEATPGAAGRAWWRFW
jgi:excisionase family DNA binding protein